VGRILGKSKIKDSVGASVVVLAAQDKADIATSDVDDIQRLLKAAAIKLAIVRVCMASTRTAQAARR